jgi:hypothetical protein
MLIGKDRYPYHLRFDEKNFKIYWNFFFFLFLWVNFAFLILMPNPDPQAQINPDTIRIPIRNYKTFRLLKVSPASVCLRKKMWGVDFHVHGP